MIIYSKFEGAQNIILQSVGGNPQLIANLKNYSITILTLQSPFNVTLFPTIKAANNCKQGISSGKLNGVIMATFP